MSAFDIAGAVVWTPMAATMWYAMFSLEKPTQHVIINAVVSTVGVTLASIYCIARLFGANL